VNVVSQPLSHPLILSCFLSYSLPLSLSPLGNNRFTACPCGWLSPAHTHFLSICHYIFLPLHLSFGPSIDCDCQWDSVWVCVCVCVWVCFRLTTSWPVATCSTVRLLWVWMCCAILVLVSSYLAHILSPHTEFFTRQSKTFPWLTYRSLFPWMLTGLYTFGAIGAIFIFDYTLFVRWRSYIVTLINYK